MKLIRVSTRSFISQFQFKKKNASKTITNTLSSTLKQHKIDSINIYFAIIRRDIGLSITKTDSKTCCLIKTGIGFCLIERDVGDGN
jgi:hypothetical protein